MVRAGTLAPDARKKKSEFLTGRLQRVPVSITIAKGNSRVLDCMHAPRLAICHRGHHAACQWSLALSDILCTTRALSGWLPLVTRT